MAPSLQVVSFGMLKLFCPTCLACWILGSIELQTLKFHHSLHLLLIGLNILGSPTLLRVVRVLPDFVFWFG